MNFILNYIKVNQVLSLVSEFLLYLFVFLPFVCITPYRAYGINYVKNLIFPYSNYLRIFGNILKLNCLITETLHISDSSLLRIIYQNELFTNIDDINFKEHDYNKISFILL